MPHTNILLKLILYTTTSVLVYLFCLCPMLCLSTIFRRELLFAYSVCTDVTGRVKIPFQAVLSLMSLFDVPNVESGGFVQRFLRRVELLPGLVDEDGRHHEPGGVETEDIEPPVVRVEARAVGEIVEDLGEEIQQGTCEGKLF